MSVKITYFVHSSTTDNEQHISSGWRDVDLSKLGIMQSTELPTKNSNIFDVVFCSDLTRAIHSAELAFQGKFPIIIDKRLRECNYGDYDGQLSIIVEPMQLKMVSERFPGGESYEDVKARLESFLIDLKKSYDSKHVAIVAHKAPQIVLDVILRDMTWGEAFASDWRKTGKWQPGWGYIIK
jgi:alpha-ribazole phosphatase/probable phosphoglycerate mutase